MGRSVEVGKWKKTKGVFLVLAVLSIVAGANGAMLEGHDFGAVASGGWANSGTSTVAAIPYGTAALSVDTSTPSRGIVAKLNSTSWLQVGADPVLAGITDKLSIDVWVLYQSTSTAMQRIVGRGYDWYIDQTSGTRYASFAFRDARAPTVVLSVTNAVSIADGLWHHIQVAVDIPAGTARMDVDGTITRGTFATGGTALVNGSTVRYSIGARATSDTLGTNMYRGSLDNVRVYNTIIPEPITIALLGLGSMLVRRFRRRS